MGKRDQKDERMEMKKTLLDSTILIDHFRKKNREKSIFYHLSLELEKYK